VDVILIANVKLHSKYRLTVVSEHNFDIASGIVSAGSVLQIYALGKISYAPERLKSFHVYLAIPTIGDMQLISNYASALSVEILSNEAGEFNISQSYNLKNLL
jgi:hypothetical protein